jgi:transcriptional regulator with AAA-type ATPase domain/TolB-like protein/Tfp pilus assembly protein PilF
MSGLDELVGRSPRIAALRQKVTALLSGEATTHRLPPLLITGETGTGKSLLARIIHEASSRATAKFVELNGAAIPETLLESELFGYERGAFTDARQSKAGLLQVAHRGTLFLDEVGLLPLSLQAKLLTVLEDGSVRRLGATRSEPVDVCIISATNEDLQAAVRARRFREDLYHRLAVITLVLPPLRELGSDLGLLAAHALERACAKYSLPLKSLSADGLAAMHAYRWPGNVRELNSVIERAVLMCPSTIIQATDLTFGAASDLSVSESPAGDAPGSERQRLSEVLAQTGWNISRTAAILGITRNTVRARIAKYGLHPAGSVRPGADLGSIEPSGVMDRESEPLPPGRPIVDSGAGRTPTDVDAPLAEPVASVETVDATRVPDSWRYSGVMGVSRLEPPPGRPSIAVLPFRVHGDNEPQAYFGDGVVEDIIGALAGLREVFVISRSSTLRYRGVDADVRTVGRDVGVNYVLSGSVWRARDRLRVSAELAETTRGTVIWASHFDGISEDLFALQDQIATRVVGTIAPQVREAELRRALRKRPSSLAAYDCVLRGLAQRYHLNLEDFNEARTWLERAIALDPGYAAPYALLADWHSIRVNQGWSQDPAADNAEVIRLATAAFERDSFDAMALALCGHVKSLLLHKFDEAIALFDRAIAASPSSAIAWTRSSPTYSYLGDAREAIRRVEEGLRLSPLDLHIFFAHGILGLALYIAGEYEEGIRWGRKAREENAAWTANLRFLSVNLAAGGRLDEARDIGRALLAAEPGFRVDRFMDGYPLQGAERRAGFAHHLRLAGLPG